MILAIDPGEMTGLAARGDDEQLYVSMTGNKEVVWELVSQLRIGDQVVIEDFLTAGKISKYGLHTVRLVGAVEALCWSKGVGCTKQVPGYRMFCLALAQDLQPLDSKHEHRHEKDALAHLLAYEYEERKSRDKDSTRAMRVSPNNLLRTVE